MFWESFSVEMHMFMRVILACILGGVIGLERETGERPAGFRTHTLVCMGSCLFMIVSIYGFDDMGTVRDPARLAAQVVSGVGFLGAGTIMHEGVTVKGLTTAASIWMISAIGLATGVGLYIIAIASTVIMLATLVIFGRWGKMMTLSKHKERFFVKIGAHDQPGNVDKITSYLRMDGVMVKGINVVRDMVEETVILELQLMVEHEKVEKLDEVLREIRNFSYVTKVENSAHIKQSTLPL